MKMLVPVDGSSASINAVKKAIEITKKVDFSIKLLSVVSYENVGKSLRNQQLWSQVDGSIIGEGNLKLEDEVMNMKIKMQQRLLDAIVDDIYFGDLIVEKQVVVGDIYEKILNIAKDENFDLIVMGNRGFSKIKRFFVGSVTQKVISEASCPVLVIHSDAED
ncbi:MAG: universal stress protein [Eubacteriaceae bacterium]